MACGLRAPMGLAGPLGMAMGEGLSKSSSGISVFFFCFFFQNGQHSHSDLEPLPWSRPLSSASSVSFFCAGRGLNFSRIANEKRLGSWALGKGARSFMGCRIISASCSNASSTLKLILPAACAQRVRYMGAQVMMSG